jgi:hypothetical protein
MAGASFTAVETGILAGTTWLGATALAVTSFEVGVLVGSGINQVIPELRTGQTGRDLYFLIHGQ